VDVRTYARERVAVEATFATLSIHKLANLLLSGGDFRSLHYDIEDNIRG
jgi:hypothetical protein